jgi:hypothetical protein
VIIATIIHSDAVQEECAMWLSNPEHNFKRNAEDTNSHRPFTMLFNCHFERVYEDKSMSDNEGTVHYYKYNNVMSNVFIILEITYCLFCMVIFLLIIYWNHEKQFRIIEGKDDQYFSDEEDTDQMSHEEYVE